jgi:hypothetical protein
MTSKIKVDNINKVSDDSNIIKKCGTTTTIGSGASNPIVVDGSAVTIGRCGGTVALASGASQTGFGRTGTVDWQTSSIKTATFTGENGKGYFVNTTGGVVTANLPASPTAGDIMAVSDYAQTATTNNITIGRNGSNIQGDASDLVISRNGVAFTLVFVDATKGWIVTDSGAELDKAAEPEFITATGGTITTTGDFKIHSFTGPGTFCVSAVGNPIGSSTIEYLVVAGGAGGGGNRSGNGGGAGGGAGGLRTNFPSPGTAVSVQGYPIVVGGGGAGGPGPTTRGVSGSNSSGFSITSAGGGSGGSGGPCGGSKPGSNGGSGGGAGSDGPSSGGGGNTPPVSPPQGKNGGDNDTGSRGAGGGGGGACGVAAVNVDSCNQNLKAGSKGGDGTTTSINGTPTAFAGGGGGGAFDGNAQDGGCGGAGGGGRGAGRNDPPTPGIVNGTAGTANTGGGGGGGGMNPGEDGDGAAGGSGIVIIRYKYQ